jgi:hypothetical protein
MHKRYGEAVAMFYARAIPDPARCTTEIGNHGDVTIRIDGQVFLETDLETLTEGRLSYDDDEPEAAEPREAAEPKPAEPYAHTWS